MAESVPVRCPSCRREHRFTAPEYPCVCGAPVAPRLDRDGTVTPVSHRVWQDDWVTLRCECCGRPGEWPRPEVGCPCGTVLRVPVTEGRGAPERGGSTGQDMTGDERLRPDDRTGDQGTAADEGLTPGGTTGQDMAADGGLSSDRDLPVDAGAEAGREAVPGPGRATGPRDGAAADERAFGSAASQRTAASSDAERTPASAGAERPPVSSDAAAGAGARDSAGAARPPFRSVTIRTALDAVSALARLPGRPAGGPAAAVRDRSRRSRCRRAGRPGRAPGDPAGCGVPVADGHDGVGGLRLLLPRRVRGRRPGPRRRPRRPAVRPRPHRHSEAGERPGRRSDRSWSCS
jgi:hypothetical protein